MLLVFICMSTLASSADIFDMLLITSGMPVMNATKGVGLSTESCGIPLSTSFQFDKLPSTHTLCFLSVRKVLIYRRIFPVTP